MEKHAGPFLAHECTDTFPHLWLIAVDRASPARGFALLVGATQEAGLGIGEEGRAVQAQGHAVVPPTMLLDHDLEGAALTL